MKQRDIPQFGPLSGVRVAHATNSVAGPFAAQLMADYGAEVTWLENSLAPDYLRYVSTGNTSAQDRRNQRNLALNIPSEEGRKVFLKLIENVDIFIEASKGGQYKRWGLTDEVLWEHNPSLVIAHISGFGQSGIPEYISRPSYDPIAQAFGCYMAMNGFPDRPPVPAFPVVGDYLTGMSAAIACLAAYHRAKETGVGDSIDVAQYEVMMRCQAGYPMNYAMQGMTVMPEGNHSTIYAGYGSYTCKDGRNIYMLTVGAGIFPKAVKFFHVEDVFADAGEISFCEINAPMAASYEQAIVEYFSSKNSDEAERELLESGIPCSRIMTYDLAMENPHYKAREVFVDWDDPVDGKTYTGVGVFPKFKKNPGQIWRGRPSIGMDNEDILGELGFGAEEIEALYQEKAIGKID